MKVNQTYRAVKFIRIAYRTSMLCVIAAVAVASFSVIRISAQNSSTGQWIIDAKRSTNSIHLTLNYSNDVAGRGNSITSFNLDPGALRGLSQAQMMSSGGQVQFQLVRDAGTLNCEGWFRD